MGDRDILTRHSHATFSRELSESYRKLVATTSFDIKGFIGPSKSVQLKQNLAQDVFLKCIF